MTTRDELRAAELELMRHQEHVAELRRSLPLEPVQDYVFNDESGDVRLSDLFRAPGRSLIVYHYMFGKAQTSPCPLCTMWIDGFNGIAHHVRERADFAVVAAAPIADIRTVANQRGWDNIRLLSAGDSSFKLDFGSELENGEQIEHVSCFHKQADGSLTHFWTNGAEMAPNQRERGMDLLCSVWNLFDITPEGRGDWYPSLDYERGI